MRSTTIIDSSVAKQSTGAYTATADLGAGTFAATSTAASALSDSYAGIGGVHLYNDTGATIAIDAGAFKLHVSGTYLHNVVPNSSSSATVIGTFTVIGPTKTYVARGSHQVSVTYDLQGNVATTSNVFNNDGQVNGGMGVAGTTTLTAFSMDLDMPEIDLPASGSTLVELVIQTETVNGVSEFTTTPSTISLTLPAGALLDSDSVVPLVCVTNSP